MATISTPKSGLDDGIQEEIEVLIEEHKRLVDAAWEEISRPTSVGGSVDQWKTGGLIYMVNHGISAGDLEGENEEEGIEIFVDKSIDKSITTTETKNQKKSYIFRASNVVAKSLKLRKNRQNVRQDSPPPPLSLSTTFDTATTLGTEISYVSEEEEHDRDGYSTSSGDTDQDVLLVPQTKEFSCLSIPDIATIMEEQQQKQEQVKQIEVQQEQKEIDEVLQRLRHDVESGTESYSEMNNETLQCLRLELEHIQVVSENISKIDTHPTDNDDTIDQRQPCLIAADRAVCTSQSPGRHTLRRPLPLVLCDGGGDNTIIATAKTDAAAAETRPRTIRSSSLKKSIQFLEKTEIALTSSLEQKSVVLETEEAATEEEEEDIVEAVRTSILLPEEKGLAGPSIEEAEKALSSPLVEEKPAVLRNEGIVCASIEEENIKVAEPLPVRKSIQLLVEEITLSGPPIEFCQLLLDPTKGHLSNPQPLLFEDHPEDEVFDYVDVEQEKEEPLVTSVALLKDPSCDITSDKEDVPEELSLIPPDDLGPSLGLARNKEGFPETSHPIPPPSPSPSKLSNEGTKASSIASLSKSSSIVSSSTLSASMGERRQRRRPSDVHGDFGRFKHFVLVAMICVVIGIGTTERWFDLSRDSPSQKLARRSEPVLVLDEVVDEALLKRNRRREIDLDEMFSTLW